MTSIWYDVLENQGTRGNVLPSWFYAQQSEPMNTIKPIVLAGNLRQRTRVRELGGVKLPQVIRVR